jgi:hypothetical protein
LAGRTTENCVVDPPDANGLSVVFVMVATPSKVEPDADADVIKTTGSAHRASTATASAPRGTIPPNLRVFIVVVPFDWSWRRSG